MSDRTESSLPATAEASTTSAQQTAAAAPSPGLLPAPAAAIPGKVSIVQYSDKSIAVLGDTKPIKDKLKQLGGRFNASLKVGTSGATSAGWIFPSTQREAVSAALSSETVVAAPSTLPSSSSAAPSTGIVTAPAAAAPGKVSVVQYSDKAIAVFGDTKPIKDRLKALGGRYNGSLKHGEFGATAPGWIFPATQRGALESALSATGTDAPAASSAAASAAAVADSSSAAGNKRKRSRKEEEDDSEGDAVDDESS